MVDLETVLQQAVATEETSRAVNEKLQEIKTLCPELAAAIGELEDLYTLELKETLESAYRLISQPPLTSP